MPPRWQRVVLAARALGVAGGDRIARTIVHAVTGNVVPPGTTVAFMKWTCCDRGSGWACNALAVQQAAGGRDRSGAMRSLRRGCALGFSPACENVSRLNSGAATLATAAPRLNDLPIILRGSKGPVRERTPEALYALACERGWPGACEGPPSEVLSDVLPVGGSSP